MDAEFGTRWLANYETSLRQRRLQEKLQSIILSTVRVSPGEVQDRFRDQHEQCDAEYALFDANTLVSDSAVQVTDADLKTYYEENIDQYKVEATRTLGYVSFRNAASADDSAGREKDMEDALAKARNGIDFLQLVSTYSDKPDSGAYFSHGELGPEIEARGVCGPPGRSGRPDS